MMLRRMAYYWKGYGGLMACAVVACCLAPFASLHAQTAGSRAVELTSSTCATIAPGDDLVFEWNPAFDLGRVAVGLQEFELTFTPVSERGARPPVTLSMVANPRLQPPGSGESPITVLANGSYRIHFHPQLAMLPTGRYELVDAAATAQTAQDYRGVAPRMTNSPARSSFCLEVVHATPDRSGTPSAEHSVRPVATPHLPLTVIAVMGQ